MAQNLVYAYSVFFQPHSTFEPITNNSIHIIDLVYTCIITFYLPLHLLCLWLIARHLITYSISIKFSEWNKAAKDRTLGTFRECKPPPSPHFFTRCTIPRQKSKHFLGRGHCPPQTPPPLGTPLPKSHPSAMPHPQKTFEFFISKWCILVDSEARH